MRSPIRRLTLGTAAALLAAGVAVAAPATAQTVHTPGLTWGPCPTGAPAPQQCATLAVPLDYRQPGGRTISVEVSRIPAADPAKRRGVLLTNGGGPSASLDVPTAFGGLLPQAVRDRYDLVAFDPRGIGHSTPMSCGRTAGDLVRDLPIELLPFPDARGSIAANVSYAKRTAARCAALSGDLLPHLTTANVARDMDRIRQALGERTVSYYGISWGTYVGAIFRALFPRTVDHMVIDSSVDPGARGYADFRAFSGAMEDRWPDLAAYGAAHHDTVRLGTTPASVRAGFLALTAALDRRPVRLAETAAPVDGNFVRLFTWQLSYNDASLPQLGRLWQAAGAASAGRAGAADRAFLAGLANGLVEDGTMPGVPQDNLFSAGWAYSCGDTAWPRDVRTYARAVAADRARFPLTAGAPAGISPCAFWPVRPDPEPRVRPVGDRNVLILQNERDPSTPLRGARGMRRAMGPDAVLVTVDAGGHGVLVHPEQDACAIGALEAHLTGAGLPARDTTCG